MQKALSRFGKFALAYLEWLAALTFVIVYNVLQTTFKLAPLAMAVVEDNKKTIDEMIQDSLGKLNDRLKKLEEIEKAIVENRKGYDQVSKVVDEIKLEMLNVRKAQLDIKSAYRPRVRMDGSPGEVSVECARHIGALAYVAGIRQEKIVGANYALAEKQIKETLGIDVKTALSSTDIPLPEAYSGEVVELVYVYGHARRYGTVFPLGAGTTKLPRLKTDTVWGLIAQSAAVTEVSPQTEWVTFAVEKFGGLIRIPTELDEDSIVAIGQFIARYAARNIARCEDYQFFRSTGAGSGVNGTAKGLTVMVNASNDNKLTVQASTKTKQTDATLQNFRDMRGLSGVSGAVLERGGYYVHPTYESLFCTFNTSSTVMPYQRATPASPATLDGFPIFWIPVMPALSSTASASLVHALFGDASFMYLGVRGGIRMDTSREAAFTTDEILIRGLERMTVGKMAADNMAGLANAAS